MLSRVDIARYTYAAQEDRQGKFYISREDARDRLHAQRGREKFKADCLRALVAKSEMLTRMRPSDYVRYGYRCPEYKRAMKLRRRANVQNSWAERYYGLLTWAK